MAAKAESEKTKRTRRNRPFPASSFEEACELASILVKHGGGQPMRRLTIFDHLKRSPDSSASRQLITTSGKYGLTKGSYQAEQIELTQDGARAVDPEYPAREQARARARLAIEEVDVFKQLYEKFVGNKLPSKSALMDAVRELEVPDDFIEEAVDTFVVNLRYVGLLQTLSGADRIVSTDHLLDSLPSGSAVRPVVDTPPDDSPIPRDHALITSAAASFEKACFYITPIGSDDSEERRHSDLFLGSIVEPALESFELEVVRADQIDKPGVITRQIIDYLLKSRLVIADLSFHNPNVFYELAIRHAARLPTVQLIRSQDRIPFDLNQVRTLRIDTQDIYTLVPKIDTYRAEIASHVRRALEDPDSTDNPITTFYPSFRAAIEGPQGEQ